MGNNPKTSPQLFTSKNEHFLTPPWFADLVVEVMGAIDTDPASNPFSLVPAAESFCVQHDGLSRRWGKRVFINPPYGEAIVAWSHDMADRCKFYQHELIALVPARVDTEWYERMEEANAICHWKGRIAFWEIKEDGSVGPVLDPKTGKVMSAVFPSAIPYWGPNVRKFGEVFRRYGSITVTRPTKDVAAGLYPRKAA